MAHCHHVALAGEDVGLAVADLAVLEMRGAQHDEQQLAVDFQLRPLVRHQRVLDREIVQPEAQLHRPQQRLVRLLQADPDETVVGRLGAMRLGKIDGADAAPALVHGAVDDLAHRPASLRPATSRPFVNGRL